MRRQAARTALVCLAVLTPQLAGGLGARAQDTPPNYPVPATPPDYQRPIGKLVPPQGALFGAHFEQSNTPGPEQDDTEKHEADAGRTFDIRNYYYTFEQDFPTWREPYDFAKGRYPLISWGCEDVDKILSGSYDALIDARADGLRALGKPLFLRWCWEMDGARSEKSSKVGTPERFIAAWRYIWGRLHARGADNVVRVWCPNARGFKQDAAQPFYPGDEWVDWICTDGYNWAPGRKEDWRSFVEIFDAFYSFGVAHHKPLMVGEWGAQERAAGDKARWIADAQVAVREKLPAIAAVVAFSVTHLFDWRVTTSAQSYQAFNNWAKDPYFNQPDPPFQPGYPDSQSSGASNGSGAAPPPDGQAAPPPDSQPAPPPDSQPAPRGGKGSAPGSGKPPRDGQAGPPNQKR
jgi:hypothetical protein